MAHNQLEVTRAALTARSAQRGDGTSRTTKLLGDVGGYVINYIPRETWTSTGEAKG